MRRFLTRFFHDDQDAHPHPSIAKTRPMRVFKGFMVNPSGIGICTRRIRGRRKDLRQWWGRRPSCRLGCKRQSSRPRPRQRRRWSRSRTRRWETTGRPLLAPAHRQMGSIGFAAEGQAIEVRLAPPPLLPGYVGVLPSAFALAECVVDSGRSVCCVCKNPDWFSCSKPRGC